MQELADLSSYSIDVLITIHLAIIESNETEAFYMLKKLAIKLQNSWTVDLLYKNILDSQNSKKQLDHLLDSYLV